MKSCTERGFENAAVPPVGSVWLGPGNVIAQGFGAPWTHEDGAGVLDFAKQAHSVVAVQLEMLGSNNVHGVDCRLKVGRHYDHALVGKRCARDFGARACGQKLGETALHLFRERSVAGHQVACGQRIVFGLRHKIGSNHGRIGRRIGENAHFRRARHHVDACIARDDFLRRGDKRIARANDFRGLRNRIGAVGKSGNGLGATHSIYLIDARNFRGSERVRRNAAFFLWRGNHNHALYASDLRRNAVHEHRRGVLGAAARNIHARGGNRE